MPVREKKDSLLRCPHCGECGPMIERIVYGKVVFAPTHFCNTCANPFTEREPSVDEDRE